MRSAFYFLPACFLLFLASQLHAHIIHIPADSSTIQSGINGAINGDTILVADGTYTGDGNRDIDFMGKAIVVMSENGPEVTIIDCEGSELDPHRGFHFHSGEGAESILQDFTIRNGFQSGEGGAIHCSLYSSPTIMNCTFSGNSTVSRGGGIYNWYFSDPTVTNCTFIGNSAVAGGGMYNYYSFPTVTNCIFSGNSADYGGAMFNALNSSPTVTNCTFIGNTANNDGGGMYNEHRSSPAIINCTFSNNSAVSGGGMYNIYASNPTVTNCILWENTGGSIMNASSTPTVTFSDVEGGHIGEGNLDADPFFVTFHGFDFLLRRDSPCIDTGDPAIVDGFDWPEWYNNGPRSDMGAYGGPGNVGWLQ